MGIDIALQEQNLLPGITNRTLAALAKRIYLSFDSTAARFRPQKVRVTGNPVREEIIEAARATAEPGAGRERLCVLVLGGSQGAHAINAAVIDGLPHLKSPSQVRFVHQTGAADEAVVRDAYRRNVIQAEVAAFFDGMGRLYREADLIVCRAGATTLAEVTATGKGSILIPYPYAADDHQRLNALAMVEGGAARMVLERDLRGIDLIKTLEGYVDDPAALKEMADCARQMGRPAAAKAIVDDLYELDDRRAAMAS
jgi:UDP-N-acetylglucosamine--N-acetylmuramyl-(pentapeptide) pyrophosphoryl-undecaprenol N-acetylglucosamine transferase